MKHTHPENRYWGSQSPPKSKSEFFNAITTPAPSGDGTIATIRLYGPIDSWGGFWGISAQDVSEILDALPEAVTQIILRINSPGGEMFEGISILNLLRAHRASVTAVVDGLAASAATIITSGSDETVMSPGTQMMIHSPWMFTAGNAAELRKTAELLDGFEESIVEIYQAKAGDKDWATLLADETWWTAAQAVEQGLADRVAVVPDAGETSTAGDTTDDVDDLDGDIDVVEDRAAVRITARASSPHMPPSSTEPGDSNRKEDVVSYDTLKAGLRERLGVTDAAASDEQLLLALEDQLTTPSASTAPELPAGAIVVDKGTFEDLQSKAQAGADARAELDKQRRDGVLARALEEGRIAPSTKADWRASLDNDEQGTTKLLASLPKNTVPVDEIGHSVDATEEDQAYAMAWGRDEKAS